MDDIKRVSLVMDGNMLLGVVARVSQRFVANPKVVWRPFSLNTDRTFTELGSHAQRGYAERAIRKSWGVEEPKRERHR